MLKYLSTDFEDEEMNAAFEHIDTGKHGYITFDELNGFFSKVNGIPEHLNKPHNPNSSVGQVPGFFQQMFNPGYMPQYNPYGGGGYYPPQQQGYYPPPQQGYGQPPPYYGGFNQPQPQPPHQQSGHGNFILDKLSQNMNSTSGNSPRNLDKGSKKAGWW